MKLFHSVLLVIIALGVAHASYAPTTTEVFTNPTPPGERTPESVIIDTIDHAKTITLAIYTMTRQSIADALIRAAQRGATITIITDESQMQSRYSRVLQVSAYTRNVTVFHKNHGGIMHKKTLCAELNNGNYITITGSYNFTDAAHNLNKEIIVVHGGKRFYDETSAELSSLQRDECSAITPITLRHTVHKTTGMPRDESYYVPTPNRKPTRRTLYPPPASSEGAKILIMPRAIPRKELAYRRRMAAGSDTDSDNDDSDSENTTPRGGRTPYALRALPPPPKREPLAPLPSYHQSTSPTAHLDESVETIPQATFKARLMRDIRNAQKITISVYNFTDTEIAGALIAQRSAGLPVTVILDKSQSEGPGSCRQMLVDGGIDVYIGKEGLMHTKAMLFHLNDGTYSSFNGSANLSANVFRGNNTEAILHYAGIKMYKDLEAFLHKIKGESTKSRRFSVPPPPAPRRESSHTHTSRRSIHLSAPKRDSSPTHTSPPSAPRKIPRRTYGSAE